MNVESINSLRRDLRQRGDEYQVVKNTLFERAAQETPVSAIERPFCRSLRDHPQLRGSGGLGQILADFAKDRETFVFKGGVLEGKPISGEASGNCPKCLPGSIIWDRCCLRLLPCQPGLVSTLAGIIQKFMVTLKAMEEQKAQA